MRIAVIDNGIDDREIDVEVIHFCLHGGKVEKVKNIEGPKSHGTICAKIIEEYGLIDCIYDIQCIHNENEGDISSLVEALRFCKSIDVNLINISNGVEFIRNDSLEYMELLAACIELWEKGVKIFAAQSNGGFVTYPADFPCVYGVEIWNNYNYRKNIYRRSDIYVKDRYSKSIIISGQCYNVPVCNSAACAYVCALATRLNINSVYSFFYGVLSNIFVTYNSFGFFWEKMKQKRMDRLIIGQNEIYELKIPGKVYLFSDKSLINAYLKIKYNSTGLFLYKNILNVSSKDNSVLDNNNLLLISIVGDISCEKKIEIAHLMKNMCVEEGYLVDIVSNYKMAFMNNIYYLNEKRWGSQLISFCRFCKSDIILMICENGKRSYEDICIELRGNRIIIERKWDAIVEEYSSIIDAFKYILDIYS